MDEATVATKWNLRPVRWLQPAIGLAAVGVFCVLAAQEDLRWTLWVIVGVAAVALTFFRWPCGAIILLVAASAMPHFSVQVFGWNARPEHFAAAIVFVAVAVWAFANRRPLGLEQLDFWILAFVVINYFSSLLGSSQPSATLKWAVQNNLAVLPYFLIRWTVRDLEILRKTFRILLIVGVAEASFGILCYACNSLLGTTFGVSVGIYLGDVVAPFGSLYEPNLFGAYTGCCAILFLALYLVEGRSRLGCLIGFVICALATTLSFSRAALLAFVITVVWLIWRAKKTGILHHHRESNSFLLAFGLIFLAVVAIASGVLRERFRNLYYQGLTEQTAISRFIVVEEALLEVPQHPLLGNGTASFNLSFNWASYDLPAWQTDRTWISNAPIRILHDCGLFGVIALLGFFVSVWRKIRRALLEKNEVSGILLGLVGGTLVYAISFQSTDGSILAFSWVHVGFLASAAVLINGEGQRHILKGSLTAGSAT